MGEPARAAADGHFAFVQALRGIAAFWVVLFHASSGHHIDALKAALPSVINAMVFDAGHYGVAIFFALSGFVIAHSLRDVANTWSALWRFVLRRSIRLDPPYWASMVVVIALAALSARVQGQPYAPPSLGAIAAHVAYLQVLLDVPPINTVYWTLTYEVQFYFILAAVMTLAGVAAVHIGVRLARAAAWLLLAFLALPALVLARPIVVGLFLDLWPAFFVGVLAYTAQVSRRAVVALVGLAALMLWSPGAMDRTFAQVSCATAVALYAAYATGWIYRGLNARWLQFLGTISYSLYLLHNTIGGAVAFLARRVVGMGVAADLFVLLVMIVAAIVAAVLLWRLVEVPSHRLSRRVVLPRAKQNTGRGVT